MTTAPTVATEARKKLLFRMLGTIAGLSFVLAVLIRLPGVPYNIRELFLAGGAIPAIIMFSIALLWIGGGAYLAAWAVSRSTRPVLWLPVTALAVSCVSLILLSLSVTQESLDDICGSSDVYRRGVQDSYYGESVKRLLLPWPGGLVSLIERIVRYVGLYGHVAVVLTAIFVWFLRRSNGQRAPSVTIGLGFVTALYLWTCKTIVFDWAITDNLTELIASGGLVFLYLLLGVLALHAAFLSTAKWNSTSAILGAALTAVAVPATWWLLNQGLEHFVLKYQRVFSAVQFLLGPDREHTQSTTMLFLRWSALYIGGVFVIALGARFMRAALAQYLIPLQLDNGKPGFQSSDSHAGRPVGDDRRRLAVELENAQSWHRIGTSASVDMTQNSHTWHHRLPGLDGLRAVACLMVFAVHFGQTTGLQGTWGPFDLARLLENGNTGVALFFALSGFLLSLPYWNALQSGTGFPAPGEYLQRRAARILPAYYACLTILVVANRFWEKADWLRDVLLHYALAFNFLDATIFRINPPFWTVAVESQFYLLLPLLFLLAWQMSARRAMVLMLALGAGAYVIHYLVLNSVAGSDIPPVRSDSTAGISPVLSYSLLAHLPHFLMGVATGWVFVARDFRAWLVSGRARIGCNVALWGAALLVFIILSTRASDALVIPYGRYNLPFVPALLCLVILLAPITVSARRLLDSPPLRWIGTVSYGVYLFHFPIQHVTARVMARGSLNPHENWLVFGTASLGLTLAVAAVSYRALEKPILNAVRSRRRTRSTG